MRSNTFNALLTAGATGIANAQGVAVAAVGPQGLGANWYPIQVAVTSTSTTTPIGYLYQAPLLPTNSYNSLISAGLLQTIGYTSTANGDSIGFVSNLMIPLGQGLVFQWIGASLGSQCSMLITGTQSATYFR